MNNQTSLKVSDFPGKSFIKKSEEEKNWIIDAEEKVGKKNFERSKRAKKEGPMRLFIIVLNVISWVIIELCDRDAYHGKLIKKADSITVEEGNKQSINHKLLSLKHIRTER